MQGTGERHPRWRLTSGDPAVMAAMREQAPRVMKLYGYESFPGIG